MNKNRVRIVLVETTHAGNIGAAARAMKTMGLRELSLVRPREYQNHECYARASGAEDIIDNASVHDSLQSALEDASWVIGTSARLRSLKWPQFDAREAAGKVAEHSQAGAVAIVFGRESSGLSNDELGRCSALLTIPTANDFSSLNLGAAVQVICYELMMAGIAPGAAAGGSHAASVDDSEAPAQQREIEGFYQHMTAAMTCVDFFNPENPRLLEGRLRRLFNRSGLLKSEVQLLRGFFAAIEKKVADR